MKKTTEDVEEYRVKKGRAGTTQGDGFVNSLFFIRRGTVLIKCNSNVTPEWEHVSVAIHAKKRQPNWDELNFVRHLFWEEDECVLMYFPPENIYVNKQPLILHLWKPVIYDFPMPPDSAIGWARKEDNNGHI